jgi:hypothetical protein
MIRMRLSTALRMPEPEIRHTTGAQPTRMIRFHVRTRESPADRPSVVNSFQLNRAQIMPGPIRYVCGLIANAEATSRIAVSVVRAGRAIRASPSMPGCSRGVTECELSS